MRIAIISDIHGNLEALKTTLNYLREQEIDQIWCCGDVIGYYPDPVECIRIVKKNVIKIIQGNHDASIITDRVFDQELQWYNPDAAKALSWTRKRLLNSPIDWNWLMSLPIKLEFQLHGRNITMVHGSPEKPLEEYIFYEGSKDYRTQARLRKWLKSQKINILILGHTHSPFIYRPKGGLVVNPGSVGQPRDGNPQSAYAILEIMDDSKESPKIKIIRLKYDIQKTIDRIKDEKLPLSLGTRLLRGR